MPSMLNQLRLPARLDSQQVSEVLGMQLHDIAILVRPRLVKPLGNPHPNAIKFFAAVEIEALARDRKWLDRAQREIQRHWQIKNHSGSGRSQLADVGSSGGEVDRADC